MIINPPTSFLQELGDPGNCTFFSGHQPAQQSGPFAERCFPSDPSGPVFSDTAYNQPTESNSSAHLNQKGFCTAPTLYASTQPSNWTGGHSRAHVGQYSAQVPIQRAEYFWPSGTSACPPQLYSSHPVNAPYGNVSPHQNIRQCLPSVPHSYPPHPQSVPNSVLHNVQDQCGGPSSNNFSNSTVSSDPMYCPVQTSHDRNPPFIPQGNMNSRYFPDRSCSTYSVPDEVRRINERLAYLRQTPGMSIHIKQEVQFLEDRLKSLGTPGAEILFSPSAIPEHIQTGSHGSADGIHCDLSTSQVVASHNASSLPFSKTYNAQSIRPHINESSIHLPSVSPCVVTCASLSGSSKPYSNVYSSTYMGPSVPGEGFKSRQVGGPNVLGSNESTGFAHANVECSQSQRCSISDVSFAKHVPHTASHSSSQGCSDVRVLHPVPTSDPPITRPDLDSAPDGCFIGSQFSISSQDAPSSASLTAATEIQDCQGAQLGESVLAQPCTDSMTRTSNTSAVSALVVTASLPADCALPTSTSTFDQQPVRTGRSTLHYRQTPNNQCTQFASVSYAGSNLDRSGQLQPVNGSLTPNMGSHFYPPPGQPYVAYQQSPPDGISSTYQYSTYHSPFPPGSNSVHTPVGCSDQHLQPIASLSPNSLASQTGSVFSQPKFESEKCNGVVVGDLSYPPILPKVPGSPSPTKDRTTKSPRKGQALDREARNERRRQQRLKKRQEEAAQQTPSQMTLESYGEVDLVAGSVVLSDSLRQSRPRSRKKTADFSSGEHLSGEGGSATERDSEKLSMVASSINDLSASPTKSKKRRNSTRLILPKQPKKNKIQLVETRAMLEVPNASDDVLNFTQDQSPVTEPAGESMDVDEPAKHVKIVRTRPPRPKKKKPLPTLIRKKKRSAFYGDESDSEPDISGRLAGRIVENRSSAVVSDNSSHDRKRRSERTAGDRKRYTIDLDLNLSDDSDGPGNGEMATLNSDNAAGMVEENDMKVVEYVLGRRVTKRVVKKVIQRHILKDAEPADSGSEAAMETIEEEDEEDVEEFYLKYKGYSYLHCEWRALDEIDDPRIRPKLRRFEMKQASIVQQEDDDVVLFNPDYVEVERVLDMKVYRNGQLISSDKLRSEVDRTDLNVDLIELRKQRKRERERNRARALREAKARAKAEAEAVLTNQNVLRRSTPFAEGSETTSRDATETTTDDSESVAELIVVMPESEDNTPSRSSADRIAPQPLVTVGPNSVDSNEPSDTTTVDEVAPLASTLIAEAPTTTAALPRPIIKNSDDDCENGEDSDPETGTRSPVNVTYYLVKWRSLPYEDATWELAQDVDPAKVKEFLKWRIPPKVAPVARDNDYKIIRPDTSTWRPIEAGIVYKNSNKLRDYQLEGVNWLTFCWFHHRNCILADEMGLGKTVQSVAFLLEIEKTGVRGPFLIIVPLSTVANWQREFENWSDLNVVVYHGSSTSRNMIQEYEIFYKRRPSDSTVRHDVYKFHALVTTFEILMTDIEFFGQIHWAAAVIDEAHRLKNKKCKLGEGLRYLELDHRVLLTGTPLQNNVEELFGLLNFLEPERFNCSSTFVAEYGDLKTEEQVESLKALLKPMMLRRLKEDVEKSLAPKEETIVEVELTNMQKKYYRAIMERNFTFLCKGSTYANAPNLMNVMMELRKCCNHPFLIKGAEEAILDEMRAHQNPDEHMSDDLQTFHALVYASGKLVLIHKLLPKLKANGHKVLIFSQMIRVLDILEDYLIHQRFQFERIDGRIHGPLRQEAIDRFTADPDKFVFLLCTKAGGLGINLTAADVVIIYDSDWNPQNDLQAQARCHRIGQQKMVKVYRLITRNTYEREMFDRASLKLGLDRAVLQSMGSKEARQAQMSKKEIEELLKKGAYGALMEDDKAGEDFCEEDIDKILQSRSRVVQLEQGEKNSTFSKATFSMSDNRSDIELDDPNFWQKWAKKAGVDETVGTSKDLIMKTPRQRRQTSRYSAVDVTEPVVHSPPSYDASELEDSANAQSSGEENVVSTSGGRGRFRRCRRQRRHTRLPSHVSAAERRASQSSLTADMVNVINRGDSCRMEALDRADLFRVERCLLTWPWGDWERGLAMIPFKRALKPADLGYYASALLAYALRFMPPSGDTRIRTTILTLTRPHVWNLNIMEVAKAVAKATSRASRGCRFVDEITVEPLNINETQESCILKSEIPSSTLDTGVESPSTTDAPGTPALSQAASVDVHDTPVVTENDSEIQESVSESVHEQTSTSRAVTVLELAGEPDEHEFSETSILPAVEESVEPQTAMDLAEIQSTTSEKPELEDLESAVNENTNKTANKSPKSACFDPDILLPCDGFRKHMQRHSARLLNRVAFLLFLQCEVIGVEPSLELMAGRLTHTDFNDLAASLPPLEAIDSELPAPWWDCCCDKCLLLGILKHGWEKYTLMRLDPDLCFYSRAMARLNELTDSKLPDSDAKIILNETAPVITSHGLQDTALEAASIPETTLPKTGDHPTLVANIERETHESDDDIETEKHLSAVIDLKEKLESGLTPPSTPFSEKHNDQVKFEEDQPIPGEDIVVDGASVDAVLTALPFPAVADLNSRARKLVGFFLRIKNQLEFDTHRRFTTEDEEDLPGQPSTVRYVENRAIKWTRREEADFYRVVSSFGVEFTPIPCVDSVSADGDTAKPASPVKRRYRWHNFRQLANITRKNDDALTEYFQSFYRMCQRVCKRTLTEFAGPASSAATTTTSGSSSLGDEVPIEPISEERANRCLSRIDLLARIRNDVLPHPQLNERLKLCQRGSEIPSWWIPGKHDGELLRAAAKHGLARTDLNILSDPEFSFCHVVSEIREKLSRETATKSCSSVLPNGSSNRSDVANIVVTVGTTTVTSPTAQKTFQSKALDLQTEHSTSSGVGDSCALVVDESAYDSLKAADYKEILDEETLKAVENGASKLDAKKDSDLTKIDAKSDDTAPSMEIQSVQKESNESLDVPFSQLCQDLKIKEELTKLNVPEADEIRKGTVHVPFSNGSKPEEIAKHVPCTELADWSIKYATAWPKDRTIQHRLELVCQAIEANEWPMARRYLPTPSAASIPVPDPNRALNEAKLMNFTSTYSTVRHPTHSAFPIPLSMHGALQPSYGLLHVNNGKHLPNVPRPLPLDTSKHMVSFSNALLRSSSGAVEDRTSKLLNPSLNESINFESVGPLNLASQSSSSFEGFTATRTQIPSTSSHSSDEFKKSTNVSFSAVTSSTSSPSYSSPATGSATPPRGRGRGRGRGSRGGLGSRALNARERISANSSTNHQDEFITQDSSPPSPLSGTDLSDRIGASVIKDPLKRMSGRTPTDLDDHTTLDRSPVPPMPPPSVASAPRSLSVGRGRQRRMDASRNSADFSLSATKITSQSKRERLTQSTTGADYPGKTSKSSTRGSASHSSNSDVWEVRVPVISLVDGSLIYGDKAPKRRVLEAWLEANPNYMPYSVEMEDRIIYSRVAGARGQDTNNMEALAYKHYLNSLIASAAAGLHQTSSSTASSVLPSTSTTSKTGTTMNTQQQQQQQLLQFQQQQQLLQAFGAYARHPAYASLIASALGSWQAANLTAVSTSASFPPTSSDSVSTGHSGRLTGNATSSVAATTATGIAAVCSTSMSTRTRAAAAKLMDSSVGHQDLSPPSECSTLGTSSSRPTTPTPETSNTNTTVVTHNTMEAVLSAAYKQATANLAYMYNPLAAAAAYNQMFLPAAGSLTTGSDTTGQAALSSQQAALASLYANYMLSAKQTQQQQLKQQINAWDQQQRQQQQLASLATAIAAACSGGAGGFDASSLMSMFAGLGSRTTTANSSSSTNSSESAQPTSNPSESVSADLRRQTSPMVASPEPNSPVNLTDRGLLASPTVSSQEREESKSEETDQSQSVLDLSK
ncbi:hypothetical protein AHF37_01226 [Paragonimus kellicotti]|nr:hypothetical protein AHF37_01226 [Paragonimus kellicotti]